MGERTKISYADSTGGLCMGCSEGCEIGDRCWAMQLCKLHAKNKGYPKDFRKPELFLHRLDEVFRWKDLTGTDRPDKPWLNGMPRVVFLNDLGETFDPQLPEDWLVKPHDWPDGTFRSCMVRMFDSPHIYIILTKQAQRMAEFSRRHPFPPNIWVGVSVTDQATADKRIPWLLKTRANKRIVSAEPLLGPVDILRFDSHSIYSTPYRRGMSSPDDIDWLILGFESGSNHRIGEVEWIRSLVDQAHAAGVAAFVKQAAGIHPGLQGNIPDELWNVKEMPR